MHAGGGEPSITLRALRPEDAPAVAELWRRGLQQGIDETHALFRWAMRILMLLVEWHALGSSGDIGPNGENLYAAWGGAEYPAQDGDASCRLMLVALDEGAGGDGAVVGCCGVKRGSEERENVRDSTATDVFSIWRMSVSENARRGGVGRRLMTACEMWAAEHGGRKMVLSTGNPAASRFYLKLGYTNTRFALFEKELVPKE